MKLEIEEPYHFRTKPSVIDAWFLAQSKKKRELETERNSLLQKMERLEEAVKTAPSFVREEYDKMMEVNEEDEFNEPRVYEALKQIVL